MSLTTWNTRLCDALGLDLDVEIDDILDLARDAAHQVERPAAPLTTFLVGYAAALRGGIADRHHRLHRHRRRAGSPKSEE